MLRLLYYLIGWAFFFAIYGIYTAITMPCFHIVLGSETLTNVYKVLEISIFVWFCHQFVKRATLRKLGLGQAFKETIRLPKKYYESMFVNKNA
jgi:hypothetical protein